MAHRANNPPSLFAERRTPEAIEPRPITTRSISVRADSIDEAGRSFEAIAITETPVEVFDWWRGEVVEEVLLVDGCEVAEQVPLLDSHMRWTSLDQLGSARNWRREGTTWVSRNFLVEGDDEVERIWKRIKQRHLRDVSVGYEVLDFVDIPAGTTQRVAGRDWTAGRRTLRISVRYRVRELSVTPIGADQQAKIRTQLGDSRRIAPNARSLSMNPRLLSYIRNLMRKPHATEEECRTYMSTLRGVERTIGNNLDYDISDTPARTTADLAIRSLGYNPENPIDLLATIPPRGQRGAMGGDGAAVDDEEELEGEEGGGRSAQPNPNGARSRQPVGGAPAGAAAGGAGGNGQDPVEAARAAGQQAERNRQLEIREMHRDNEGRVSEETMQRAIDENWSLEDTRRAFRRELRHSRGEPLPAGVPSGAPAGHARNSVTNFERDALVAAMMLRGTTGGNGHNARSIADPVTRRFTYNPDTGGTRFVDASRDDAWCRAVDRGYELRSLSQVEIARRALALGGINVEPVPGQIVRAFMSTRATAVSINAYLGIYTQTFGAIMLSSFEATPDTTVGWTIDRDNPNFLQNERHRITKGGALTKHHKGGEADHFSGGDTTEYTRVFRYSGQSVFDEMDLINDTMFNALTTSSPDEMGESARQLRPDLVYAILLANPNLADGNALFYAPAGNLLSGTLNKEHLQDAYTAIATQQENGRNLNLRAKYVIVPEAKSWDADEFVNSNTVVITGDTDTIRGQKNSLSTKGLVVVSDSRLDNGVTDPNSGTTYSGDTDDYYVSCEGSRHTIEVTHLRGSGRVPEMRSGMLQNPGQWGIWFDVKQDIGATPLARQGICKVAATS